MSSKAEKFLKDVNATMELEGMPLMGFDMDLIARVIDGVITREEAIAIFNKSVGIYGEQ